MNPIEAALANRPKWMDDGICAQTDPDAFYPEVGETTRFAKAICMRCPVTAECLAWALEHHERFGVWGGMSERERRRLREMESKPRYQPPTPEQVEQIVQLHESGVSNVKTAAQAGVSVWTVRHVLEQRQANTAA